MPTAEEQLADILTRVHLVSGNFFMASPVDGLYMFSRMIGSGTTRAKLFAVITSAYPVAGKTAHVRITGYRDDLDA